ncbi:MAG: response regulator [Hoeflea sp.]|uniref:hybrid sensor histidine kinase/response regulator n=1 Tax=Hoeflea sp. TaxID=1940281 RepID=UPI001DE7AE30|nr:response regulator [Hoeflea sp.]MBU4529926.1 response regulator [Alphaproteobacteria bacterium]MBU4547053.1 response regulator [Alphaproteobacteria bacterium]MBU4548666.1 response regulator [Alphaproteobacteria bacterium]MBV1722419.1 response regulator [Hoeflea sp.]MBV1762425.1 response regulator [Hoeflea sp.]
MTEIRKDQAETAVARRSVISLRIGFVVSLTAIAIICTFFFLEQSKRNDVIQQISNLSERFAELDQDMAAIADQSNRLSLTYTAYQANVDPRLVNATLAEKQRIRAEMAVDPDIISAISSLRFRFERARWKIAHLRKEWERAPAQMVHQIQSRSRYMTNADPFLHYLQMLGAERIDAARTKQDMYWAGREIHALYEEVIRPSNTYVQQQFRDHLAQLSLIQGALLQRYLLATMGILVVLGLGVFVPIDIIIRQMIKRLQGKTRELDLALTKAQTGDRAKSEFLATMSHEIRTPMNGVLGMAELLTRTDLDTRQRTFTDVILKSGNALLEIINDILDFSKIDAGQLVLSPKPFNLIDTTEDVATLMSSRVVEKDIELVVRIAPGLPDKLIGDPGRLRQILTNLVGNAVKFTEQGHVMVDINWRKINTGDQAERLAISVAVRDTGIGIPPEKLDSIFDKFSQVDGSSTRKHEGTGLGLAIATRLVELMGGKIEVESEVGVGSTFSFTIEMDVHGEPVAEKDPSTNLPGRRVLVIDDNAINRMILTEQIRDWGFDCVAVEGGEIGLDLLRHARSSLGIGIDLVVLDFQMPGMSGAEVAQEIRSDPLIADTPILILSSVDQADQLQALNDLEIFAQLTKPVRTAQLRKTVQSALNQPHAVNLPAEKRAANSHQPASSPLADVKSTSPKEAPDLSHDVEAAHVPVDRTQPLVLVAEDNQINQIVFQQTLDGMGYEHRLAVNGREAVRLWAELRPTLVLMDVSMPELNGLEATAEIRSIEARDGLSPTPIIAVTAHSLKGDEDRCLAAGMDDYLSKPISPEKLGAMIDRWMPETSEKSGYRLMQAGS